MKLLKGVAFQRFHTASVKLSPSDSTRRLFGAETDQTLTSQECHLKTFRVHEANFAEGPFTEPKASLGRKELVGRARPAPPDHSGAWPTRLAEGRQLWPAVLGRGCDDALQDPD